MSRGVDNIKDINDNKEVWKVAVKVDDIWTTTRYSKEYAEMIIRDIQGDSIHVMIGPEEYKKRTDELAELMKLKTFTMTNFRVQPNDDKFKLTPHAYKMLFISGTSVQPKDIPNMPVSAFKFKKFEEIQSLKFAEDILVGSLMCPI
ncbi:replication factor-a protein 1 (Rpa1) family protein, partial [Trifolium pratense]